MIKRWKVLAVIALVGVVSCEKEDLSTPHPGDKNDYPEEPPVLDLPEPTCDLAVVIEEAQSLDGQHLCPQTDVTLTVSMTQTDSISFMKVYKNSITGEEQHYLIETVYDGAHSITRVGEELMDYLIYAIVYENSCVDKTPRFSFSGYDFAPPAIEHDKLHTGLCGPDGFVQIRNGFPGPTDFKWYYAPDESTPMEEMTDKRGQEWITVENAGYYKLAVSYPECPDYFMSTMDVLFQQLYPVKPEVVRNGDLLELTNGEALGYIRNLDETTYPPTDRVQDATTYWFINGQEDRSLRYKTSINVSDYPAGTNIQLQTAFWQTNEDFWALPEYEGGLNDITCSEYVDFQL